VSRLLGGVAGCSMTVFAGEAGVVVDDVAVVVDGRGGRGGLTRGCGAVDGRGGVLVGPCGFGVAADGGYSTISGDDGATVVSDVARVVGGSRFGVGVRGARWGGLGAVDGGLGLRLGSWG
jgi:hypothetical protein